MRSLIIKFAATAIALCSTVSADTYIPEVSLGSADSSYNTTAFQQAELNPIDSKSFNFTLFDFQGFEWLIHISQAALNSTQSSIPNATAYFTSYSFTWPGASNLAGVLGNQFISQRQNASFCVEVVGSFLPAKTTNNYKQGTGASCMDALGSKCYNAIVSSNTFSSVNGSCRTGFISDLDECKGIVSVPYEAYGAGLSLYDTNVTYTDNTTHMIPAFHSGQSFFYDYSPAYSGSNATWLQQERDRLHLMVVYMGSTADVLCARVDPTDKVKKGSPGTSGAAVMKAEWFAWTAGVVALGIALVV